MNEKEARMCERLLDAVLAVLPSERGAAIRNYRNFLRAIQIRRKIAEGDSGGPVHEENG